MQLPESFYPIMRETLGADYEAYQKLLFGVPYRGLRVQERKITAEKLKAVLRVTMEKTPFCSNGYYIDHAITGLGNHPLHHGGAFYLQEPSAMSAVTAMELQNGDKVLDLCAAPGGKTTQIGEQIGDNGLLVSNEIIAARANILASNVERWGLANTIVLNEHPEKICAKFSGFFDKVLVDAPCSGEGMLRREPNAAAQWKPENRIMCAKRQLKILESAAKAVRTGGTLVYSTCTLSGEENEQVIEAFLNSHKEFVLSPISACFGRPAYRRLCNLPEIEKARRILYMDGGEGHFVAKMNKISDTGSVPVATQPENTQPVEPAFIEFWQQQFQTPLPAGRLRQMRDKIVLLPENTPDFTGLKVIKPGVWCGEIRKGRFLPHHALYMIKTAPECNAALRLYAGDKRVTDFLRGMEIPCDGKGYTAVCFEDVVIGFGKASNGVLKNHYPKGLRII